MKHIPPSKARKNLNYMEIIGSMKLPPDKPKITAPAPSVEILSVVALAAENIRRRNYESIMKEIMM